MNVDKTKPVKYNKRSAVVDILALDKAIKAGTLSDRDRATVERIFPGISEVVARAGRSLPGDRYTSGERPVLDRAGPVTNIS
jgi:hypothetical protein